MEICWYCSYIFILCKLFFFLILYNSLYFFSKYSLSFFIWSFSSIGFFPIKSFEFFSNLSSHFQKYIFIKEFNYYKINTIWMTWMGIYTHKFLILVVSITNLDSPSLVETVKYWNLRFIALLRSLLFVVIVVVPSRSVLVTSGKMSRMV